MVTHSVAGHRVHCGDGARIEQALDGGGCILKPWQAQGMRRFDGRGVVVTGGASGIGTATARRSLPAAPDSARPQRTRNVVESERGVGSHRESL